MKNISLTFFKFQSIPAYSVSGQRHKSTVLLHWGGNYNKVDNYFVVSADRQTFLGFEMTANLHDASPLRRILYIYYTPPYMYCCATQEIHEGAILRQKKKTTMKSPKLFPSGGVERRRRGGGGGVKREAGDWK